ncbi:hypothetical protein H1230_13300 [Paenibacillus sp. 19GGS1-52]|uniref:hypothetical protein n=1 Tax=Paenibacillus sp. 19GGS1-52 TaxID=2758563 RepID=UPI001EFB487B|nr:hypothetical protein [Paenibacillus sp. 19GGS1-52]ULO09657.1 hypothetical protein H1230_13300 [Paenibacillus sp. 19GGS1-52]
MNEEFKVAMQGKFDKLMERMLKEVDGRDGLFDHLLNGELLVTGLTTYDRSKFELEVSVDSYTALFGYKEQVIYRGNDINVADYVQDGLLEALNNSALFCDEEGIYSM